MGDESYVVRGAKLKCSFGSHSCKLNVLMSHGLCIKGNPVAAMSDCAPMVNVMPFGFCKIPKGQPLMVTDEQGKPFSGSPCIPAFLGPWLGAKTDVMGNGQPILTDKATLACAMGGKVEVVESGQK